MVDSSDAVTTKRAVRRLKPDPIPEALLRRIMAAAICAPSGGNRQGWRFVVVRDPGRRARLGELYREGWSELVKLPYYASAAKEPAGRPVRRVVDSAAHLAEDMGEAPVIIAACITLEP